MVTRGRRIRKCVGTVLFWAIFAGIFLAYSQGMFSYCSRNVSKVHGSYNRSWINSMKTEDGGLDVVMLGDSECYSYKHAVH